MEQDTISAKYNELKEKGLLSLYPKGIKITVGMSTCGIVAGADKTYETFGQGLSDLNLEARLTKTGCLGLCEEEPLVYILVEGKGRYIYGRIGPGDVYALLSGLKNKKIPKQNLLCKVREDKPLLGGAVNIEELKQGIELFEPPGLQDIKALPFFARQMKIATRNSGLIDPISLEEYVAMGGYEALKKALLMDPEDIIETVMLSGLRGRGGAGFPTGAKWHLTRQSEGKEKYVICNADEGNPGAYMDRSILEGDPFSVLEGMTIGGYAMGAQKGIIYLREEYPLAASILNEAIKRAMDQGFLGEHILGGDFSFHIEVIKGHRAYVCGEETALIASIEGKMGEPRPRPPFPTEKGLYGRPTCINNVQTWAYVPPIIALGHEWFRSIGTEYSKGTKVFSVVGDVQKSGVVEIPMGTPIGDIVNGICGGPGPWGLKAVEMGGPGGGFLPVSLVNMPVSYEGLLEVGAALGAGLVVLGQNRCMVDMALHFMEFAVKESCGKCLPCREGTLEILRILRDIAEGRGVLADLRVLEDLSTALKYASLCGLGQTAPNPIMSALKYFKEEFLAHISHKFCPAGVCKGLFRVKIDRYNCNNCGECMIVCSNQAISKTNNGYDIDVIKCNGCGNCIYICPIKAIKPIRNED